MLKVLIFNALILATAPLQGHTEVRQAEVWLLADAIVDHADWVDPWTLAALAVKETKADVHQVGLLGECGAMQVLAKWLRPRSEWSCERLATPAGSVQGSVQALSQWRDWAEPRGVDPLWCYAAGEGCLRGHGHKATRRLWKLRALLRASVARPSPYVVY